MNADALRSSLIYVYYLRHVSTIIRRCYLGNSGRYRSVYKLQDRIQFALVKSLLVSRASCFNWGILKLCLGGLSPQKNCGDGNEFWDAVAVWAPDWVVWSAGDMALLLFTQYKNTWLDAYTTISSHCLAALPATSAFKSIMQ